MWDHRYPPPIARQPERDPFVVRELQSTGVPTPRFCRGGLLQTIGQRRTPRPTQREYKHASQDGTHAYANTSKDMLSVLVPQQVDSIGRSVTG